MKAFLFTKLFGASRPCMTLIHRKIIFFLFLDSDSKEESNLQVLYPNR